MLPNFDNYDHLFFSNHVFLYTRWNFSVGNFELKLLPETQSGINFLEGEVTNADMWKEDQRVITDEPKEREHTETQQNQNLDLVIKVSVPDWKVMAFSSEHDGQLVWEHQVRCCKLGAWCQRFI